MTKPATSVIRYSRFFALSHAQTVLDYGAGNLRNAVYLAQQGFTVYAADLHDQVKALRVHPAVNLLAGLVEARALHFSRLSVDLVVSTYVFNIIQPKAQRRCYLDNIVANLRPGGFLLMELLARHGSTPNSYFNCDISARIYTHRDVDRLLTPYGFQRICHYYSDHAVAVIYRLAADPSLPLHDKGAVTSNVLLQWHSNS
jgi:tellurite methyltransferase